MRWMAIWTLTVVAVTAGAQMDTQSLGAADKVEASMVAQEEAPLIDGSVRGGEYGVNLHYDGIVIGLALVRDTVYVSAAAETTGWVAVGFGSDKMDGARILFSFVDGKGRARFTEQEGSGHKHRDVSNTVATAHAVAESDGITTLEAALPVAFIRGTVDESGLFPMIMAYGMRDSMRVIHRFFNSIELVFGGP